MRPVLATLLITTSLLTACSQKSADSPASSEQSTAYDVAPQAIEAAGGSSARIAAPGINVTSAPGVAFNYRYAFVLPDKSISAVQELHASACEKLGPAHCRITGMRYSLVDEDSIQGQLEFKLDPVLARNFGKEGIAAVEKAEGRLVDAAIEGTDVGGAITASQKRSAELNAELTRIEQRLASGGISESDKADLREQANRIRQQQSAERGSRAEGEEQLANTPMTFNYSGDAGFSLGNHPFGDAAQTTWGSFSTMLSLVLITVGALLPWLALLALLLTAWRSRAGVWLRGKVWQKKEVSGEV